MNISLNSGRTQVPAAKRVSHSSASISIASFVVGLILMLAAARFSSPVLAIPGFVGTAGALMYWNILFWNWFGKDKQ